MKLGSHFDKHISIWVHFVGLNSFLFFLFSVLSAMIRGAHDGKQFVCTDYEEKDLDEVFESFFKIEWLIFQNRIEWIKRSYIFVISYISTMSFFAKILWKTLYGNRGQGKAFDTLFECFCNLSIMSRQSFASFIKVFRK